MRGSSVWGLLSLGGFNGTPNLSTSDAFPSHPRHPMSHFWWEICHLSQQTPQIRLHSCFPKPCLGKNKKQEGKVFGKNRIPWRNFAGTKLNPCSFFNPQNNPHFPLCFEGVPVFLRSLPFVFPWIFMNIPTVFSHQQYWEDTAIPWLIKMINKKWEWSSPLHFLM